MSTKSGIVEIKVESTNQFNSPSMKIVSVVEGASEIASSLQRLERRASVSSISPGRDLRDDNHRSNVAYMLTLIQPNPTSYR